MIEKLKEFVEESNRIEGILTTQDEHVEAHRVFLSRPSVGVVDLIDLLSVLQPNAELRSRPGMDVYIGMHTPPGGGSAIPYKLTYLLNRVNKWRVGDSVYKVHCDYETLHPFTDGNGRTGRAIWAWMQLKYNQPFGISLGFLHAWYYQSLAETD